MKKVLYTLLMLVVLMSLSSCKNSAEEKSVPDSEEDKNTQCEYSTDDESMLARGKDCYMHCKYDEAFKYFSQAAKLGNVEAKYYLALCYYYGNGEYKDEEKAVSMLDSLATNGYLIAYSKLGGLYENGLNGIAENKNIAQTYYKKSFPAIKEYAEKGDVLSQYRLGFCYFYGCGVEKDEDKATRWFRKAAEQDCAFAQTGLGNCYSEGVGVLPDKAEAVKWWRKAANQGDSQAQCLLGTSYLDGYGVEQDYNEAVKWLRKSAEQGYAPSLNLLGTCYKYGVGVSQDYQTAAIYYRKAQIKGM